MRLLSTVVVTRSTVASTMDAVCSPRDCAKVVMLSPRLMSKVLTRRLLPSAKPNQGLGTRTGLRKRNPKWGGLTEKAGERTCRAVCNEDGEVPEKNCKIVAFRIVAF